jgi:hypothetical protein
MYALAVADLLFEFINNSISRIENFAKTPYKICKACFRSSLVTVLEAVPTNGMVSLAFEFCWLVGPDHFWQKHLPPH